ncbi:response regulator [Streptomyces avicenniae]|uniref:response regulator n=1 Tax=Streptomyces avicenniae TaxID=500153 RepID=UPI00069BD82C|nr:response regulator transcription factor [Streptomyces avicenniae]
MTVRILLADDQAAVRTGFRIVLDAQPDLEVVGEAADGREALARAAELEPDVVLADIRMPGPDGLEVTRLLAPATRVIVVTTYDLDAYVHTALRNGACGFLLKRSGPALLAEAVRAAVSGEALISPSVTVRLLRHLRPPVGERAPAPYERLTERENAVARLVAQGMTNTEIAAELFITPGTAKTHVAHIQRKLGTRNRVGIAAHVWDSGLAP